MAPSLQQQAIVGDDDNDENHNNNNTGEKDLLIAEDDQPRAKKRARLSDNNHSGGIDNRKTTTKKSSTMVRSRDFLRLEYAHPYGIQPEGNRFFLDEDDDDTDAKNNDRLRHRLSDELWHGVLEFCSGRDLAALAQTCCYFYATGSQPELWRDLVLRRTDNTPTTMITRVGSCWKDTYVKLFCDNKNNGASKTSFRPHIPIPMKRVFSESLYRLHSCRAFAIPDAWLEEDEEESSLLSGRVPRVDAESMTNERFAVDCEQANKPVLVGGAALHWKAYKNWSDPQSYFCSHHATPPDQGFRATSGAASLPGNFALPAYLDYCCKTHHLEEAPLYLFDRTALRPGSRLWKDYFHDLCRTCPYWDPNHDNKDNKDDDDDLLHHDLFGLLGEGKRPDHTWLIMGPKRSGSVFHIDPNATHAWNAAIVGRKRWLFYPPGVTPPGVHPSEDGDRVALPLSIGEWLFQFWDEHAKRRDSPNTPGHERPLECTAMPGDVLFVPHGWWHMVINLDEINVAITHNYVSKSNLPSVLKFLNEKRDQVSGCRDRSESIKPERLYEAFVSALRDHHPRLLRDALEKNDWACRAWKSTTTTTAPQPEKSSNSSSGSALKKHDNNNNADIHKKQKPEKTTKNIMEKAKGFNDDGDGADGGGFSFSFLG